MIPNIHNYIYTLITIAREVCDSATSVQSPKYDQLQDNNACALILISLNRVESINQSITGHFGYVGLHQMCTKHSCIQLTKTCPTEMSCNLLLLIDSSTYMLINFISLVVTTVQSTSALSYQHIYAGFVVLQHSNYKFTSTQ